MKKYRKKENTKSKLLQIRLSEKEHKQISEFINRFGVTQREWLLAVYEDLREANLLINGEFYSDWQSYAYSNSDKWDKKITQESICEECRVGYFKEGKKEHEYHQLERHHYLGYIGENAFKVQILCRKCHARKPKCIDKKEDLIKQTK